MKGYSRYENLIANWTVEYVTSLHEGQQNNEKLPSFNFFEKTVKGFMEIASTLEALRLTYTFVSLAPPRSLRIKKPDYLKYHVSVYLQETYILKERLNTYATRIQRIYSKGSREISAEARIKPLFAMIKTAMDDLVLTRSAHVHERRYTDEDLDEISMFGMISDANQEFEEAFQYSYGLAKSTWKERIKKNNAATMKLIDHYFDELYEVITINDEVYIP